VRTHYLLILISDFFLAIEFEQDFVPWAASGSNVVLNLTSVDPLNLSVGSVLCPQKDLIPLATTFTAKIIVFDIAVPITAGSSVGTIYSRYSPDSYVFQVELFHHSRDVPATTVKLISTIDRASGKILKINPRYGS